MLLEVQNKIISLQLKLSKKQDQVPFRVQVSLKIWQLQGCIRQQEPIELRIHSIVDSQQLCSNLKPLHKPLQISREYMLMLLKNKKIHSPENLKKIKRHSERLSKCEILATPGLYLKVQECLGLCQITRTT